MEENCQTRSYSVSSIHTILFSIRFLSSLFRSSCRYYHHTSDNIQIKSRAQQILRKQKKGVPIFEDLKQYRRGNPILIHTNYQLFMGCGLPSGQSMLSAGPPPRPASDVLQAACGLAMLEERPLVFPDSYFGPNPPSTAYLCQYLSGSSSNNNNKL
jgi:hypothetical protein